MSNIDLDQGNTPLCIDLDGTLIKTDSLYESLLLLLKQNPFYCIIALFWIFKSKAYFKAKVAERVQLPPQSLPYNDDVIQYIQSQPSDRLVLLITGSHISTAESIANHLKLFDEVIASDSTINMTRHNKCQYLVNRFGENSFEYVGNDMDDIFVWQSAKQVSVVSRDNQFLRQIQKKFTIEKIFLLPSPSIKDYLKAIRVHQWVKNTLIFVPFFLNQKLDDFDSLFRLAICFICLSLLASGTYIMNDLLDLQSDRLNRYKRGRAFASGLIPIKQAVIMMAILTLLFIVMASLLPSNLVLLLLLYLVTTSLYSFYFKTAAMLDVCVLAGLFTLRIFCGIIAIQGPWSFWLLVFSMFFFLSLAFAKRFSELDNLQSESEGRAPGRGYYIEDKSMLKSFGTASGFISILVIALYLNSTKVSQMYAHPEILWLICPLLLYWIGRIWLITGRGQMHEDPIVFAIKDSVSLVTVCLCGAIVLIATALPPS
ncbi:MAG: hypothetical protein COB23_08945 [Methylophaga sp.]|nr:MAG: hypothetical protein COB23_08945 [Methylophaga sp.]